MVGGGFESPTLHQNRKSRNRNGYGVFLVFSRVSAFLLILKF